MAAPAEFDVAVIGGGPAGSTIARWLAIRGHRVCMLHRHSPKRRRSGRWETLAAGAIELMRLHYSEAWPKIAAGLIPFSATVRWSRSDDGAPPTTGHGALADREAIDRILRDAAVESGVAFHEVAAYTPLGIAHDSAGWTLSLANAAEPSTRSRFLVEATGRASALPGRWLACGPRTLAITARVRGTCIEPGHTRVEALPDGWLWAGRGRDSEATVTLFAAARTVQAWPRGELSACFASVLQRSALASVGKAVEVSSPLDIRNVTPAERAPIWTDGLLRVGDAALALDPLSGQGFQLALRSAVQAAITVHTITVRPESALLAQQFYLERHREAAREHAVACADFYRRHDRFDGPFWKERALNMTASTAANKQAKVGLSDKLILSSRVRWVQTPVIEGDFIENRLALSHPSLTRPIAYLEGRTASSLLGSFGTQASILAVLGQWAQCAALPPVAGMRVLRYLLSREIVLPRCAEGGGAIMAG